MFRMFKKRENKASLMYGVAQTVGVWWEKKQRLICDKLNARFARFSSRQLKSGLFVFCLLYLGFVVLIVGQALIYGSPVIRIDNIKVPIQVIDSLKVLEEKLNSK